MSLPKLKVPSYEYLDRRPLPISGPLPYPKPLLARPVFRELYTFVFLVDVFVRRVPFWLVSFTLFKSTRPRREWSLFRSIFFTFLRNASHLVQTTNLYVGVRDPTKLFVTNDKHPTRTLWIEPVEPELIKGQLDRWLKDTGANTARIPGYWYGEGRNQQTIRAAKGERVIYNLHGGGYIQQSAHHSDATALGLQAILKACRASPKSYALPKRALSLDYRTSSVVPFPGILADALAGYKSLLDAGFEASNIVIMGDSAGGNLALALTRYLRDTSVLPKPQGLILLSPWLDLYLSYNTGPGSSSERNKRTDYLTDKTAEHARDVVLRGMPRDAVISPYVSAITLGRSLEPDLFEGFPPSLIFVGGSERLLDQVRDLRLHYATHTETTYYEEPLATHDWMCFPHHQPEFSRTVTRIRDWLVSTIPKACGETRHVLSHL